MARALSERGCTYGQGFHYAEALPADQRALRSTWAAYSLGRAFFAMSSEAGDALETIPTLRMLTEPRAAIRRMTPLPAASRSVEKLITRGVPPGNRKLKELMSGVATTRFAYLTPHERDALSIGRPCGVGDGLKADPLGFWCAFPQNIALVFLFGCLTGRSDGISGSLLLAPEGLPLPGMFCRIGARPGLS